MANPNRRSDIVAAARQVFAEDGFERATIKRIAKVAGLKSTALIYWYFENKHDLLQVALKSSVPLAELPEMDASFFEQPPEVVLPFVLHQHLMAMEHDEIREIARIAIPQIMRDADMSTRMTNVINPVFELLKQYMEKQVEIGRFRPHDSNIAVRQLIGISIEYALTTVLFPTLGGGLPDRDAYLTQTVETFIRGLNA